MKKFTKFVTFSLIFLFCALALAFSNNLNNVSAEVFATSNELQDRIDAANSDDTIEISGNISIKSTINITKKITLSFNGDSKITRFDNSFTNFFNITSSGSLTIVANSNSVEINGGRYESNFDVNSNSNYSIFYNSGTLDIRGVEITNNSTKEGGAIYNTGKVNIEDCTISLCYAMFGAGFYNKGEMTVNNCSIEQNTAYMLGGGGVNFGANASLTLNNSDFNNNSINAKHGYASGINYNNGGYYCGGAGLLIAGGEVEIKDSGFSDNFASDADNYSIGGAILASAGSPTISITGTSFQNNVAFNGGAIAIIDKNILSLSANFINNKAGDDNGQDLYIGKHLTPGSDIISSSFLSEDQISIVAEGDITIGDGFEIADGSRIVMNNGLSTAGVIYVVDLPVQNEILVEVKDIINNQKIVEFLDENDASENVFKISNKGYKLELTSSELFARNVGLNYNIVFVLSDDNSELLSKTMTSEVPIPDEFFNDAIADIIIPEGKHIVFKDEYGNEFDRTKVVDEDITVYVAFESDIFDVKFFIDGNQVGETLQIEYGELIDEVEIPNIPDKTGYTDVEPFWVIDGEDEAFDFSDGITADLNLVANYTINKYTISFYTDDDGFIDSLTKEYGSTLLESELPEIPAKVGYDQTAPYYLSLDIDQPITSDANYYAYYTINTYTVSFMVGDIEIESQNINHGGTAILPDLSPAPLGYDQTAPYWALDGEPFDKDTLITENLIIYELFTINTYEITFTLNYYKDFGETLEFTESATIIKEWHSQITEEDLPSFDAKAGYSGEIIWSDYDITIEDDCEIVGSINKDVFAVEFKIDGIKQGEGVNVEYGKQIDLEDIPTIPSKEGYTQILPYWVKNSENNAFDFNSEITAKLTLNAKYIQNIYVVTFILPDKTEKTKNVLHGETVSTDGIISASFGEVIKFDKSLDNITEDQTIIVSKINVILWAGVGAGGVLLIGATILLIKIIKKRKINNLANSRGGKNKRGKPFFGDDEY